MLVATHVRFVAYTSVLVDGKLGLKVRKAGSRHGQGDGPTWGTAALYNLMYSSKNLHFWHQNQDIPLHEPSFLTIRLRETGRMPVQGIGQVVGAFVSRAIAPQIWPMKFLHIIVLYVHVKSIFMEPHATRGLSNCIFTIPDSHTSLDMQYVPHNASRHSKDIVKKVNIVSGHGVLSKRRKTIIQTNDDLFLRRIYASPGLNMWRLVVHDTRGPYCGWWCFHMWICSSLNLNPVYQLSVPRNTCNVFVTCQEIPTVTDLSNRSETHRIEDPHTVKRFLCRLIFTSYHSGLLHDWLCSGEEVYNVMMDTLSWPFVRESTAIGGFPKRASDAGFGVFYAYTYGL